MNIVTTNNVGSTLVNGRVTARATQHRVKITNIGTTTVVRWFGGDAEPFLKENLED